MAFSLISSSDRTKLLKSGLNNQRKAVEYYINRGKLVYKCFTCNQIDHLNKINGQTKKSISCAQTVYSRAAKEEIRTFRTNAINDTQQLVKIIINICSCSNKEMEVITLS